MDLSEVRKISMLETPVLERLQALAREGEGGILEIGSYIGGSTIALASGHMGRRKHAVIDCGGSYTKHPTLPSDDILRDWRANVSAFGVAGHVRMFEGWSTDSRVFRPAIAHSGSIGLFFFDGDGRCAEQFDVFARYMRPGCVIVLDDFITTDGGKGDLVRPWIEDMQRRGALVDGELVDCTWFGRLGNAPTSTWRHFKKEAGHAWLMPAVEGVRGQLFENGKPLTPADCSHADIRELGLGRHSHWIFSDGPRILFSTSDNSDPNTNGRCYEFRPAHYESSYVTCQNSISPAATVMGDACVNGPSASANVMTAPPAAILQTMG